MTLGNHVPVIEGVLVEKDGNTGIAVFNNSGPIAANVGVICVTIVILIVVVTAH